MLRCRHEHPPRQCCWHSPFCSPHWPRGSLSWRATSPGRRRSPPDTPLATQTHSHIHSHHVPLIRLFLFSLLILIFCSAWTSSLFLVLIVHAPGPPRVGGLCLAFYSNGLSTGVLSPVKRDTLTLEQNRRQCTKCEHQKVLSGLSLSTSAGFFRWRGITFVQINFEIIHQL